MEVALGRAAAAFPLGGGGGVGDWERFHAAGRRRNFSMHSGQAPWLTALTRAGGRFTHAPVGRRHRRHQAHCVGRGGVGAGAGVEPAGARL